MTAKDSKENAFIITIGFLTKASLLIIIFNGGRDAKIMG